MVKNAHIQQTIRKFASVYPVAIDVLDTENCLLYSSCPKHFEYLPYRPDKLPPPNRLTGGDSQHMYWTLLRQGQKPIGKLVVCSDAEQGLPQICESIRIALNNVFELVLESIHFSGSGTSPSRQHVLIESVLSEYPEKQTISSLMSQMELSPSLLRAVICISLTFKTNEYFNINLNLGYMPLIDKARNEILTAVQENKYLTTQDLCAYHRENEIVIIKSFIAMEDISRIYLALDKICQNLEESLSTQYLLDVKIAYGNIYTDILDQHKSYREAREIIRMGSTELPHLHIYRIENVLVSSLCQTLSTQVVNKFFIPLQRTMRREYPNSYQNLLDGYEAFIDNCMNFSEAAKQLGIHRNTLNNRLLKLEEITGLKPTEHFPDALLLKLFAVFIRQQAANQEEREG